MQSKTCACFFWKKFIHGSTIKLLDYIDDMVYFGTSDLTLKSFWYSLSSHFDVEFLGQAHWYLSTHINQDHEFNITLTKHATAN